MTVISKVFNCVAFPGFTFFAYDLEVGTVQPLGDDELSTRLRGKRALVVGGTSGIGRGIAETLAAGGASVVVAGSSSQRGQEAVQAMQAASSRNPHLSEQTFEAVAADLSTVKGCVAMARHINGLLDFLVFTVGVWPDKEEPRTADGIDKVIALDVLARFAIVEELTTQLNSGARVMSVLGSTAKMPPAPTVETIQQLMMGKKTSYLTPQMLAAAGAAGDAWLQCAPARHPGMLFIGTFPGVVATNLIVTSKTLPSCLRPVVGKFYSFFATSPAECGMNHVQVLVSPNAEKRPTTYFNTLRVEGRKAQPLAYDEEFCQWVWSWLEEQVAKLR